MTGVAPLPTAVLSRPEPLERSATLVNPEPAARDASWIGVEWAPARVRAVGRSCGAQPPVRQVPAGKPPLLLAGCGEVWALGGRSPRWARGAPAPAPAQRSRWTPAGFDLARTPLTSISGDIPRYATGAATRPASGHFVIGGRSAWPPQVVRFRDVRPSGCCARIGASAVLGMGVPADVVGSAGVRRRPL